MSVQTLPVSVHDHASGPVSAPVTLVEYGNYECLHCRRAYPFIEALREELGDELRFVYRHLVQPADFPHAEGAAEAAEAAGVQGKFWEMHAALSSGAPILDRAAFVAHATRLGLDVARFTADLDAHRHRARVHADLARGIEAGVRGTPSFFIDGEPFAESWNLDALRSALIEAAAAVGAREER